MTLKEAEKLIGHSVTVLIKPIHKIKENPDEITGTVIEITTWDKKLFLELEVVYSRGMEVTISIPINKILEWRDWDDIH